jgi:hypothetical protein
MSQVHRRAFQTVGDVEPPKAGTFFSRELRYIMYRRSSDPFAKNSVIDQLHPHEGTSENLQTPA